MKMKKNNFIILMTLSPPKPHCFVDKPLTNGFGLFLSGPKNPKNPKNPKETKYNWKKLLFSILFITIIIIIRASIIIYFELNMNNIYYYLLLNIPILFIILSIKSYISKNNIYEFLLQLIIGILLMISCYLVRNIILDVVNNNEEIKYCIVFLFTYFIDYFHTHIGAEGGAIGKTKIDMIINKMDIRSILNTPTPTPGPEGPGQSASAGNNSNNNPNQPPASNENTASSSGSNVVRVTLETGVVLEKRGSSYSVVGGQKTHDGRPHGYIPFNPHSEEPVMHIRDERAPLYKGTAYNPAIKCQPYAGEIGEALADNNNKSTLLVNLDPPARYFYNSWMHHKYDGVKLICNSVGVIKHPNKRDIRLGLVFTD
jgi:hypothetical protein